MKQAISVGGLGGPYCSRPPEYHINITIDFDPSVPDDVRQKWRITCQRDFVEDFIRAKMNTDEYRQGYAQAVLGMPLYGYRAEIGHPVTYERMVESYAHLKYGHIEPSFGYVHPATFMSILDVLGERMHANPRIGSLPFLHARISADVDVEVGFIVWKYDDTVGKVR